MEILKIVGLGLSATVMAVTIRSARPEMALMVSAACAVVMFVIIAPYLMSVASVFTDMADKVGLDGSYLALTLRIIGVAYLSEFGAQLCRDAGEGSIASKIELAGKVVILAMGIPVVYGIVEIITRLARS